MQPSQGPGPHQRGQCHTRGHSNANPPHVPSSPHAAAERDRVHDVDLMKAEQEEDHLDVPIPNSRYDNSLVVTRVPNAVL